MSEPFIGEIRRVSFPFAPRGWALCNGQLLAIQSNQALFALLGVTYGGDGRTNFKLPDLRGRSPIHPDTQSNSIIYGEVGGAESVTLQSADLPAHTHGVQASSAAATEKQPDGRFWAAPAHGAYGAANFGPSHSPAVGSIGGSQPHQNMAPYLVVNYIIALQGVWPSRG